MPERCDRAILTQRWRGKLWSQTPVVVVEDRADMVVLHVPGGTRMLSSTSRGIPERDGWSRQERLLASLEMGVWNVEEKEQVLPLLLLLPLGTWWGVTLAWREDGSVFGWKVDAQEPLRRTGDGFETMDLILDVIAQPDLSTWTLKDAGELDAAHERGLLTTEERTHIVDGIDEAIRRLQRRESPFDPSWAEWRPEPAWDQLSS